MILIHCKEGSPPWHPRYRKAFMDGLSSQGEDVAWTPADRIEPGTEEATHIIFGPNFFPVADKAPHTIKVDRCSFGKDGYWVSLPWYEWGGRGAFYTPSWKEGSERMTKWGHLLPEVFPIDHPKKSHAVILGEYPSPSDDKNAIRIFYQSSMRNAVLDGLTPVYYRPHPQYTAAPQEVHGAKIDSSEDVLLSAKRIYTHKTTFGVTCALRGLPVRANSYSLASHMEPGYFEQWREWMLFTQWHIDEISSGEFWRYLKCLKH